MATITRKVDAELRRRIDELLRQAVREGWTVADTARAIAGFGLERRTADLLARTGIAVLVHA